MSLNLKVEFMGISFGKCFLFSRDNLPTCFRKPITLAKIFLGEVGRWGGGEVGRWGGGEFS
jgi:hypothetical protein